MVHVSAIGADRNSDSVYARTKGQGEAQVLAAFPEAVILRPSLLFGPEDQFFNRFAAMARISPFLPVIGGNTRFQPVYVGDVADAVTAALSGSATEGAVYELGGPGVYTFRELLKDVCKWTQHDPMLLPVPFWMAKLGAFFTQWIPGAPVTVDQVRLLQHDNVVSDEALKEAAHPRRTWCKGTSHNTNLWCQLIFNVSGQGANFPRTAHRSLTNSGEKQRSPRNMLNALSLLALPRFPRDTARALRSRDRI